MVCAVCGLSQAVDHDTCHIRYDSPKTYDEYLIDSEMRNKRIFYKYGAPREAQPPGKKYSDYEYRKTLMRSLTNGNNGQA